ncbi:MAG: UDP-glucose 4-epimerase GalE [Candidatus Anoxymicrobium japonicum]|uniref:UDP-glucose 4-epimerase n=1 Tax=Candidatus Anoxymicrobium japonicum TaxID=2013648 RepID=A0A2N3G840_9ACTN|nr:MAG: UDP-glucose 4-epimerase GalE [Candidatus Anoxymicrobium japonicum]
MRILVTGGAGYIGSVTSRIMADEGHDILVVDNLSKGHPQAVQGLDLEILDIEDASALLCACEQFKPDACIHFAARSLVGESMAEPLNYFRTNVSGSVNLMRALVECGCRAMVFSSSAATYGAAERSPILETDPTRPINPYGLTKLMVEWMLEELARAGVMRHASLRYFNAAGADPVHNLGEDHTPETHLLPRVIASALGLEPRVSIYGTDYPTPDGTCVRDYIHIVDLARAHILAVQHLEAGGDGGVFNLGNGAGFSVREVIDSVKETSGKKFEIVEEPRREGDPPELVASSERIKSTLGWSPSHPGLADIVKTAWEWHSSHPSGYEKRNTGA